jgi:hypothetical protein
MNSMPAQPQSIEAKLDAFYSVLLNESKPLPPDSPLYVKNLHFDPNRDVVADIARDIRLSVAGSMSYFTGNRGTGKSTELLRLKQRLESEGQKVFYIDLNEYLVDGEPPDIKGLLVLLALSFAHELDVLYGADFRGIKPLSRFWTWLKESTVDIEQIDAKGIKLKIHEGSGFQSAFAKASQDRSDQWVEEARTAITEMAVYAKAQMRSRGVVVLFDSFERLRAKSPLVETAFFAKIAELFNNAGLLRFVGLHVVYSVPPYLPVITNIRLNVRLHVLGSVRVFNAPDGASSRQVRAEGLARMREVLDHRYEHWRELIGEAALDRLATMSGGDLRLFLNQLVREVVSDAYSAAERLPLQPDDSIVLDQIQSHKNQMSTLLYESHLPVLSRVSSEREIIVTDAAEQAIVARLFDERLLFNYANGTEWVDANPLVWDRLKKFDDAAATEKARAAASAKS